MSLKLLPAGTATNNSFPYHITDSMGLYCCLPDTQDSDGPTCKVDSSGSAFCPDGEIRELSEACQGIIHLKGFLRTNTLSCFILPQ